LKISIQSIAAYAIIGMAMALPPNLSDNYLKQSQINTVVVQQEEMDRVGVEPTTSASQLAAHSSRHGWKRRLFKSHPIHI
jgi:hypothetical protein